MLKQIICTIKIKRAPKRHDNIDFQPIITTKTSKIRPLSIIIIIIIVVCDKEYDWKRILVREGLKAYSIIHVRYPHIPIWRTHVRYRKKMKWGYYYYYSKPLLYNQRNNKDNETIMSSVIKRLFGEYVTSRLVS